MTANEPAPDPPTAVEPQDLKHLPALHGILATLNDPAAGVNQLARLCAQLPSLAGRVVIAARRVAPHHGIDHVDRALKIVGNRGLESVLMEYLEDLTILKADLEEAIQAPRQASEPPASEPPRSEPPVSSGAIPGTARSSSQPASRRAG